jgi:DNA-binding NarL/FixJ family response regulator
VADIETTMVYGDEQLICRAGHLFDTVRDVCATRDLVTGQPQARAAAIGRVRAARPGGFEIRKLLSPAALADDGQRARLLKDMAEGTQVRISSSRLPHETIILDRRAAIVAGRPSPRGREYTVTTSPVLVDGVYALFAAAWEAAADLGSCLRAESPALAPEARAILRTLGAALTDEAAARQLGTSLRTYQRRVAELMVVLDAGSRFQAGLHARELGLAPLPETRLTDASLRD